MTHFHCMILAPLSGNCFVCWFVTADISFLINGQVSLVFPVDYNVNLGTRIWLHYCVEANHDSFNVLRNQLWLLCNSWWELPSFSALSFLVNYIVSLWSYFPQQCFSSSILPELFYSVNKYPSPIQDKFFSIKCLIIDIIPSFILPSFGTLCYSLLNLLYVSFCSLIFYTFRLFMFLFCALRYSSTWSWYCWMYDSCIVFKYENYDSNP